VTDGPTITEVLVEPGESQVWVTFDTLETHRLDLLPLIQSDTHESLILQKLFDRVKVGRDARHLVWPGGACLDAPHGPLPVGRRAILLADQRYRPLLPFLHYQQPPSYLRP